VDTKQYITRKKILERFGGISVMTLWRWERDERLAFPKPTSINRRKYYDLAEIEAWERKRASASDSISVAK
jgi:predicted DNA-binding transcriptional regulator AlpA